MFYWLVLKRNDRLCLYDWGCISLKQWNVEMCVGVTSNMRTCDEGNDEMGKWGSEKKWVEIMKMW